MALNLSILDHSKWPALLKVARLDRPIGSLLLLWPTLAALWIAAEGTPSLHLLIVFSLGTLLTRSAGCVVNDLADQKLDGHVKRTALRPLATGEIVSRDAIEFMVLLLLISLGLVLTTNLMTIVWAIGAVAAAGIYPFFEANHAPAASGSGDCVFLRYSDGLCCYGRTNHGRDWPLILGESHLGHRLRHLLCHG